MAEVFLTHVIAHTLFDFSERFPGLEKWIPKSIRNACLPMQSELLGVSVLTVMFSVFVLR